MPAPEYLDLTARFTAETDRNVWTVVIGSFGYLARVIGTALRPNLATLVRHRVGPAVERLGWEAEPGEDELERQLRGDLLRAVGTLGDDPAVQERARELYGRHQGDEPAVDPNVLPALIAILAWSGGEEQYELFLSRFKSARTPQEEQRYLYALAGFRRPDLLARTLSLAMDGQVRSQDAPFLVRAVLANPHGRELAWDFVKQNYEAMAKMYPGSAYRRLWEGITMLVSPEGERDVIDFVTSRGIALGGKTLEQYLEQLHVAVTFQQREAAALQAYLGRLKR